MNSTAAVKANYSIALVNYKSHELTKACLELLRQGLQGSGVPVFVVDNYSADASTDYLRTLDWITLIERERVGAEAGHMAHSRALDLALEQVETEYLFVLHTDTFIYDFNVFTMMIDKCNGPREVAAVGCVEQLNRGLSRSAWRLTTRFIKHHYRRSCRALGLKARLPKPYKEHHLKSFCALWNTRMIKKHGLRFSMGNQNPGYEMQDRMAALGYNIVLVSPGKIFKYLDHIQSGTVSAMGGYTSEHRRTKMYNTVVKNLLSVG